VSAIGTDTLVINPEGNLPADAQCRVSWRGRRGGGAFFFATAALAGTAPVIYDRRDPTLLAPFPDDYWLVDDPGTPSGKRIGFEFPDLGDAQLTDAGRAIAAAIADRDGFSPIQSMVIQLPEPVDAGDLPLDEFASIDSFAPIALFDVDPWSPAYGARVPFTLTLRSDPAPGGSFEHTAILFPATRLEPGGTYALALTRRVHATGSPGRPLGASSFFEAVSRPALPGEAPEVTRARASVEPVLAFLESVPDVPIPREDVALALRISIRSEVFDPSDLVAMKEALLAAPPPALNVESIGPFYRRAAVIRGTVELPFYLGPVGYRRVNRDPVTGRPVPVHTDSVPFVLTLPQSALDGPVPIVFYQHGNPGSAEEVPRFFNEFLDDAGYAIGGITDVRNRLLGTDQDLHNQAEFLHLLLFRRLPLFDLQSYADMLGFLRAIQGLGSHSWLPLSSPDALPEIDPSKILFRGISQGSHYSLAFLPLAPEVTAAASVVGGGRAWQATIHQFNIEDFALLLPTAHPVQLLVGLAAIQNDSDRQDSHFLARNLYREPLAVAGQADPVPPDLLWLEGIGDSLVPNNATRAAANELGIPLMRPVAQSTPVLEEADAPLSANIGPGTTAGHFQYDPANTPSCVDFGEFEGHYCPQIALEAEAQTLHFFETALDPSRPAEIIDPFGLGMSFGAAEASKMMRSRSTLAK
jgi:hypothetical protein